MEVTLLKQRRAQLSAKVLSSSITRSLNATTKTSTKAGSGRAKTYTASPLDTTSPFVAAALAKTETQHRHEVENLYRLGAGATLFSVRDPDPASIDNGRITGIRIEVFVNGRFLDPYYVLLNRLEGAEEDGPPRLRIHRHTIPPCIPLPSIAAKYLPLPQGTVMLGRESSKGRNEMAQNLSGFVRTLRRELIAYHGRLSKIQGVKRVVKNNQKESGMNMSVDTNMEANEMRIETDESVARIVFGKEGEVEKCVSFSEEGREWDVERAILSHGTLDGLGELLTMAVP
jgi:central kinetochore subunit Mal2/MCM21